MIVSDLVEPNLNAEISEMPALNSALYYPVKATVISSRLATEHRA